MKKIILIFLLLFFSISLFSQSLVDAAKKERERRKKIKKKIKVITNQDLRNIKSTKGYGYVVVKKRIKGSSVTVNEVNPDDQYKKWRTGYLKYVNKIKIIEKKIALTQKEYDALNFRFKITHNPNEKLSLPLKIEKKRKELDNLKKQLTKLKKELEDFKENGRRAGVPPGYFR